MISAMFFVRVALVIRLDLPQILHLARHGHGDTLARISTGLLQRKKSLGFRTGISGRGLMSVPSGPFIRRPPVWSGLPSAPRCLSIGFFCPAPSHIKEAEDPIGKLGLLLKYLAVQACTVGGSNPLSLNDAQLDNQACP
jgi:hypothetical protein